MVESAEIRLRGLAKTAIRTHIALRRSGLTIVSSLQEANLVTCDATDGTDNQRHNGRKSTSCVLHLHRLRSVMERSMPME